MNNEVTIPLEYAKSIHRVLENHVSLGFAIVSIEIKQMVSKDAYDKLMSYMMEYHNANCGPFNRALLKFISEAEKSSHLTTNAVCHNGQDRSSSGEVTAHEFSGS